MYLCTPKSLNYLTEPIINLIITMKKILMSVLVASLAVSAMAQEKFEQGKPNDDNYRYLDEYKGLKEYIDKTKYPNFKLGIGTRQW